MAGVFLPEAPSLQGISLSTVNSMVDVQGVSRVYASLFLSAEMLGSPESGHFSTRTKKKAGTCPVPEYRDPVRYRDAPVPD